MELDAVVKKYDLQLTRNERNLVASLEPADSKISGERYEQRMKDLAASRETLKQLPDKQISERQRRLEKAAILKQRLKMLRQAIPFLSPSALKSLKAEMKQIAAQLASLDSEGSSAGSSSDMAPNEASTAETPPSEAQAENAQDGENRAGEEQQASWVALQQNTVESGESGRRDHQMKETVEELKNLYKTVLAALKRKQQSGSATKSPPDLRIYSSLDTINNLDFKV